MEANSTLNKIFNTAFNMTKGTFSIEKDLILTISSKNSQGVVFNPVITKDVILNYEWVGSPGKLTFSILLDNSYIPLEGDQVSLQYKNQNVFLGYIFIRSMSKDNIMNITAYDQLRYLKNKDYYRFENVTASEILTRIAQDFNLKLGEIEDTVFKFKKRIEDNKTLFDIILTALSLTTQNTKKGYVLYDNYGALTLKNIENMKLIDVLFDDTSAADFSYSSSIDSNTYNKIKLSYENKDAGKRDIYITKDSENIERWGLLQYYEKIGEFINGKEKAEALIYLHNAPEQKFNIKDAFGDIRVIGGASIMVMLQMAETTIKNFMIVRSVSHKFSKDQYFMDLDLVKHFSEKAENKNYIIIHEKSK